MAPWRHNLLLFVVTMVLAATFIGCAKPAGVIFPAPKREVVWPPPPQRARIRYVGQVSTSADLKPKVSFGEQVGSAFFGKKQIFSMLSPYAVCSDGENRLFVADSNGQFVHVFDFKTRVYQRWAPASLKHFAQPVGIAYAYGRLLVADSVAQRVYVFGPNGATIGEIGVGALTRPAGLAFDPTTNRLYVADAGAHQVVIFGLNGEFVGRLGSRGTSLGQFNFPTNVVVDSHGRLYVSDSLNFRVQEFGPDLRPKFQIGRKGDSPGYFSQPKGLAVDTDDHLYVVDANFEAVQIFDANGELLLDFGSEGHGEGEFWLPAGIYIDGRNRIWVADTYNRRIEVFDYLPEGSR